MNEPPQNEAESQELVDTLIAISVVARHLARKLENRKKEEKENEQEQRTGGDPG